MPKICIIIPVYNAEPYICRCLESVLSQSFQDFQVILVNDGSRDNSLALCEEYKERDPRFVVLDKINGGAASARNLGLDWAEQNSSAEWLCFLDIDDFIHERYLELLLSAAQELHTGISVCAYCQTNLDAAAFPDEIPVPVRMKTEALWCAHQLYCTVPVVKLFARTLFADIRFPEGIIHEDEFTLYKVLFQCEEIAYLDSPLYAYYQTETSVMRGAWTPRHMMEPEGLHEQLQFFRQNCYDQAASYTARIYLLSLYNNLLRCRAVGTQYAQYTAILKKRLHSELLHYRMLSGMKVDNEPWLFYEAFPIRSIPHKIRKKLKSKQTRKKRAG